MLQSGQKNGLLFATWLIEHGYSRQLLSRYRSSGWLSSLCKGVMYRTGDTLSAAFLSLLPFGCGQCAIVE